MSYNTIKTTVADGVGHLQMTLHATKNAITDEQFDELGRCLEDWLYNDDVTVVLLSGTEKYLSTGLDLTELDYDDPVKMARHKKVVDKWYRGQLTFPKPIIVALAGPVIGGGADLAVFSDIRVASENVKIGFPQIKFGWLPYFDPLTRIVGEAKTKELLWMGDIIDATEAERIGFLNKVVPEGTVVEESLAMAKKMAKNGTKHMKLYKEMMTHCRTMDTLGAFTYCQTAWSAIEGDPKIKKRIEETVTKLKSKSAK